MNNFTKTIATTEVTAYQPFENMTFTEFLKQLPDGCFKRKKFLLNFYVKKCPEKVQELINRFAPYRYSRTVAIASGYVNWKNTLEQLTVMEFFGRIPMGFLTREPGLLKIKITKKIGIVKTFLDKIAPYKKVRRSE